MEVAEITNYEDT